MKTAPITLNLGNNAPTAQLHFDGKLTLLSEPGQNLITAPFLNHLFSEAAKTSWYVTELEITGASDEEAATIRRVLDFWPTATGLGLCFQPAEADTEIEAEDVTTTVTDLAGRRICVGDTVAVISRENGREDQLALRVVTSLWRTDSDESVEILAWEDANSEDGFDYCEAAQTVSV